MVLRQVLDIPVMDCKISGICRKNLVTYADDAVIVLTPKSESQLPKNFIMETALTAFKVVVATSIKEAGLVLNVSKTRCITDNTPFDFLGFELRRGGGISPSKKIILNHHREVTKLLKSGTRIANVNSKIWGFYFYYAHFCSGKMCKSIGKLDWYNT
jgi:hypothetical protein